MKLAGVLLFTAALLLAVPVAGDGRGPLLSVYLPDYRVRAGDEPRLFGATDLILFSAKPGEDGTVDFSRITPELLAFAGKARREKASLRVTVCVGGWGRGKEFATAVSSEDRRKRFVEGLIDFCDRHSLDGVDVDWEFPRGPEEHEHFSLFLELLGARLHRDDRILTVALGYTRPLPKKCWPAIDYVHLMSYQPWTPQPYGNWLEESVVRFLEAGLPPGKLVVGTGFFAKEKAGERRAVSWKKLAGTGEALPESEHGFWPVGTAPCDRRVDLVEKYRLGGVMVWDYGHDSPDPEHSLLRYLSGKLKLAGR